MNAANFSPELLQLKQLLRPLPEHELQATPSSDPLPLQNIHSDEPMPEKQENIMKKESNHDANLDFFKHHTLAMRTTSTAGAVLEFHGMISVNLKFLKNWKRKKMILTNCKYDSFGCIPNVASWWSI